MRPTMKALVLTDGEARLVDRPVPAPGPDEVLVRSTAALVCPPSAHHDRVESELGHEAVGVVAAVGERVDPRVAAVGERVIAVGQGRLAEYFTVRSPERTLVTLDERVTDHQALYAAGPLVSGLAALESVRPAPAGAVAVFGQGAGGLAVTLAARLAGAGLVIAVESAARRQKLSLRCGADVIVDPLYEDPVARIRELTGGRGVDAALTGTGEWTGSGAPLRAVLSPAGRVTEARCSGPTDELGRVWLERALRLIERGRLDPTPMTTHEYGFELVGAAWELVSAAPVDSDAVRPLIVFNGPTAPLGHPTPESGRHLRVVA
ncbi:zinc-dependent alcohol dehydrogenase [Streptomyces sp. BI20]|uniref:zinc-dependent alcohol dehydrogenase n=1 Tax=Streptomyces sp. BI20 TaxID=3403460 RepID=UPI003C7444CA